MKIGLLFNQLSAVTRSRDWRLSFVPFIIACVYLWMGLFELPFSLSTLALFLLSICTSFGFAALGYYINEYFDQKEDYLAGKVNKLVLLSRPLKFALLLGILCLTFLPWIFLPSSRLSFALILAEVLCFLLYSLPFPRLKNALLLAGILDALYAYLIPGLLSFETFRLLAQENANFFPLLFFITLFFIGYRNIFLHQIKDILKDQKSGLKTLPQFLGVQKSYLFLRLLFFFEISLILAFSVELCLHSSLYILWLFLALAYLVFVKKDLIGIFSESAHFALLSHKHLLDLLYQLWFPLVQLALLAWMDWKYLLLLPLHLLLLVDRNYLGDFWDFSWHQKLRPLISICINYPIFLLFKLFGVNLKQRQMNAMQYIKAKFRF